MKTVILTSYFSAKEHPQFGDPHLEGITANGRVLDNDISYLGKWYNSVKALGIEARVFYDNLTGEFVNQHTTKKIKFIKVGTSDYSYNDWRYFCFRDWLQKETWDAVFMTDGSDVTVVKDPSGLITEFPDKRFFVCKDTLKLIQFPYLQFHQQLGWENFMFFFLNAHEWDLINNGVIGGRYSDIMLWLDQLCFTRTRIPDPKFNSDIWTSNFVFRNLYRPEQILIGEPVTSVFKGYQTDRKDVYFIHK